MTWEQWESKWHNEFLPELRQYLLLAGEVEDFVEHIATHDQIVFPTVTEARFLERLLLRRLGEEYRTVHLLAKFGHGVQAMSGCANVFELAQTLGYVVS